MNLPDYELIRRALVALLGRLEDKNQSGEDRREKGSPSSIAQGEPPIMIVVLGGDEVAYRSAAYEERADAPARLTITHPGLERFELKEELAPRSCFMEPNRACVNSGACEMRGY